MVHSAVTSDQKCARLILTKVLKGLVLLSSSLLAHSEAEGGCLTAYSELFQVLAYSCVYSYYNQDTESIDIVEQQTESLELHTNALQILLGKSSSLSKVNSSSP